MRRIILPAVAAAALAFAGIAVAAVPGNASTGHAATHPFAKLGDGPAAPGPSINWPATRRVYYDLAHGLPIPSRFRGGNPKRPVYYTSPPAPRGSASACDLFQAEEVTVNSGTACGEPGMVRGGQMTSPSGYRDLLTRFYDCPDRPRIA